jgi:hypothetical protein
VPRNKDGWLKISTVLPIDGRGDALLRELERGSMRSVTAATLQTRNPPGREVLVVCAVPDLGSVQAKWATALREYSPHGPV